MEAWDDGLGRTVLAFALLLLSGVWVQMSLYHWGGAFRRREMVIPVLTTPAIILFAALVAQVGGASVRNLVAGPPPVLPVAYALANTLGLIGMLWHA
jgi:hypothetical protein